MSTNQSEEAPMLQLGIAAIENLDTLARNIYRRTRTCGSDFDGLAYTTRSVLSSLKHLKAEAEYPGSPLTIEGSYARQLVSLVEGCDFKLRQLDAILEKYAEKSAKNGAGASMDGEKGWTMSSFDWDKVDRIQSKLEKQILDIEMFLDTIQLNNPVTPNPQVNTNGIDMELILNKVDAISARIRRPDQTELAEDEEELWRKFRDELVREGFSKEVLWKHQDVLRGYIRRLEAQTLAHGDVPKFRGFLEAGPHSYEDDTQLARYQESLPPGLVEDKGPPRPNKGDELFLTSPLVEAFDSSKDESSAQEDLDDHVDLPSPGASMGLISTRDIMTLDRKNADLAMAINNVPGSPGDPSMGPSSPAIRQFPPAVAQHLLLSGRGAQFETSLGTPPRSSPSHPKKTHSGRSGSPPPVLRPYASSAPMVTGSPERLGEVLQQQRFARLAPDSHGRDIPLDATWTRIRRKIVSPEVLARAGVRYEARPNFVAVLGSLTHEEVTAFAHQSKEIRDSRAKNGNDHNSKTSRPPAPPHKHQHPPLHRAQSDTMESKKMGRRSQDRYHPTKYRPSCVDIEKDPRNPNGGMYVVHPDGRNGPHRGRNASIVSELYDTSSSGVDSDSEDDSGNSNDDYFSHGTPRRDRHRRYSTSSRQSRSPSRNRSESTSSRARSSTMPSTASSYSTSRSQPYHHILNNLDRSKLRGIGDNSNKKPTSANAASSRSCNNEEEAATTRSKGAKSHPSVVPNLSHSSKVNLSTSTSKSTTNPSSSTTTMPKPILKNRNDDPHVRFDPEPTVFDGEGGSYVSSRTPRASSSSLGGRRERERGGERHRSSKRSRDKDEDKGDYYSYHPAYNRDRYGSRSSRAGAGGSGRKSSGKSSADRLRAVGLGSAAASLLSVLTEAAASL